MKAKLNILDTLEDKLAKLDTLDGLKDKVDGIDQKVADNKAELEGKLKPLEGLEEKLKPLEGLEEKLSKVDKMGGDFTKLNDQLKVILAKELSVEWKDV